MTKLQIACLAGDGIGPEVMQAACPLIRRAAKAHGLELDFRPGLIGGIAIDEAGSALPAATRELCDNSQAVLMGSIGGPQWDKLPPPQRPELGGLLALRQHLKLHANLRPAKSWPGLESTSPLAAATAAAGFDMLIVRELTGGVYFGQPKELNEETGLDTMVYHKAEVRRIAEVALKAAQGRNKRLANIDKANVLSSSMLWRDTVAAAAAAYPEISLTHYYVDNAAMQLILNPGQFDVLVAGNLFGDIISDEAAALCGSLGLLPSASLGGGAGLYEPAGGSAPDIAGKGIANPIAQILSGALMLRYSLDCPAAAAALETAIEKALAGGARTADIAAGKAAIGTAEMAAAINDNL